MSRTDAHQEWIARHLDKSIVEEQHDHRSGECDLLPLEQWVAGAKSNPFRWHREHHCNWRIKPEYYYTHPVCSCDMCHPKTRHLRRRDRQQGRRQARAALIEYEEDDE